MQIFVATLVLAALLAAPAAAVWPMPQSLDVSQTVLSFTIDSWSIVSIGNNSDTLTDAISRYSDIIAKASLVGAPIGGNPASAVLTRLNIDVTSANQSLGLNTDDSYKLSVASPVATLTATTVYGALRGLETFSQLVYKSFDGKNYLVSEATIVDHARFQHRGIMIDTARHYLHLDVIMQHLDAMSYTKANVLHWHIVDDQSFPYVSKEFPKMSGLGSYNYQNQTHIYTPAQVQQVIAYAKARGIRVIVEFDTPGHTNAWGKGEPDLLTPCYADGQPDGSVGPVNPTLQSTFTFLKAFFTEVSTVFPDHYLHLGGDEVSFDCWMSNPEVQAWMKAKGWTDYALLEQYYEETLLGIVNDLNRGYIVWQEIFDNGLKVRPDTVIDVWKGGWQDEIAAVTAANLRAILSSPWYLNYISYGEDWPKYYAIEPLNFTGTAEAKKLVMGGEACLWAEFIDDTNAISRTWPRAAAVAERLWSAESVRDVADATDRLHWFRCRLLRRGLAAEPPSGPSYCDMEYVTTYSPPWSS